MILIKNMIDFFFFQKPRMIGDVVERKQSFLGHNKKISTLYNSIIEFFFQRS